MCLSEQRNFAGFCPSVNRSHLYWRVGLCHHLSLPSSARWGGWLLSWSPVSHTPHLTLRPPASVRVQYTSLLWSPQVALALISAWLPRLNIGGYRPRELPNRKSDTKHWILFQHNWLRKWSNSPKLWYPAAELSASRNIINISLRWSWSCSLCHWSSVTDLRPVIAQVRVWPVSPVHRSQDWLLVTGLVTAHTLVSTDWWVGNTRTHVQVKALSIVTHFSFDLFNSF